MSGRALKPGAHPAPRMPESGRRAPWRCPSAQTLPSRPRSRRPRHRHPGQARISSPAYHRRRCLWGGGGNDPMLAESAAARDTVGLAMYCWFRVGGGRSTGRKQQRCRRLIGHSNRRGTPACCPTSSHRSRVASPTITLGQLHAQPGGAVKGAPQVDCARLVRADLELAARHPPLQGLENCSVGAVLG
jgi:hypothetical protein